MSEKDAELKYFLDKKRVDELGPITKECELAVLLNPSGRRQDVVDQDGEQGQTDTESKQGGDGKEDEDTKEEGEEGEDDDDDDEQLAPRCPELAYFAEKHQDHEYDARLDAAYEMYEEDHLVFNKDLNRELEDLEAWIEKSRNEKEVGSRTS